jgi:hypothetical protein
MGCGAAARSQVRGGGSDQRGRDSLFLPRTREVVLYRLKHGTAKQKSLLAAWPLPRRPRWVEHVNAPHTDAERYNTNHTKDLTRFPHYFLNPGP